MSDIISGNSINLFIKKGNEYHTIAHSTTFSLSLKLKTNTVKSKDDDDNYKGLKINNIYWTLEGESLVVDDEFTLLDLMTAEAKLRICYGIVEEGATEPPVTGYVGECLMTDIELEANTGDKATYKYTLSGCSPLMYGNIQDIDGGEEIIFSEKTDPVLNFIDPNSTVTENDDNDYDISDLNNPSSLPIRFIVQRVVTF